MLNRIFALLALLALASGCTGKLSGGMQSAEVVPNRNGGGDAEAVHGGDPLDLKLSNARNTFQRAVAQMNAGQKMETLAKPLYSCNDFPVASLCQALNASAVQREKTRDFMVRNMTALASLAASPSVKILPTSNTQTQPNPDGSLRTVLAWTKVLNSGAAEIYFNEAASNLSQLELLALMSHEFGHILADAQVGRISDNTMMADFTAASGDGRYFLDLMAAELAVWAYETMLKPDPGSKSGKGKGFAAGFVAMGHGGTFNNQSAIVDFDGDGFKDLMYVGTQNEIYVSRWNGTKWDNAVRLTQFPGTYSPGHFHFIELNGDRKTDLLYRDNNNAVTACYSAGNSYFGCHPVAQIGGNFVDGELLTGDFNGDFKTDMIYRDNTNRGRIFAFDGNVFNEIGSIQFAGIYMPGLLAWANVASDPDNVKREDLMYRDNANRFWLYKATSLGFQAPEQWMEHGGGATTPGMDRLVDFNGDGLNDLMFRGLDNQFYCNLSQGNRFGEIRSVAAQGNDGFDNRAAYYGDFNGDGKVDLLYQRKTTVSTFEVLYSDGMRFLPPVPAFDFAATTVEGQVKIADVDNDGRADVILQSTNDAFTLWISQEGR